MIRALIHLSVICVSNNVEDGTTYKGVQTTRVLFLLESFFDMTLPKQTQDRPMTAALRFGAPLSLPISTFGPVPKRTP